MPTMVKRNRWILYKHTCNYELIKAVALMVKNQCKTDISVSERYKMQERLAAINLYKTRNPKEKPLDSIAHRINTLEYWMFGYEYKEDKNKRFVFSPLGNLFLKFINDEEKLRKIFIAMLFAFQFQHQGSGTDKEFQLYPFRLIFQLLCDERIEYKLYHCEVECLLSVSVKTIDFNGYEKLVENILELREKTIEEKEILFKKDEHTYVNAVHEWEYFTVTLFSQIGIIAEIKGDFICKLFHPSKTNAKSSPTCRNATNGYISLANEQKDFVKNMLSSYSYADIPLRLDDTQRMRYDVIKEIYGFYPKILLDEIGESDELSLLLELPKLIEEYSINPDNEAAYKFEEVLEKGFNMFMNVEAKKIGGAGHTDIECLYIAKKKKFAVESKSTANKLLDINSGRLREQREKIGGEYTIVITPRYVPAAKRDIKDNPIVIILASTFAEYLYNHIFHEVREIDYADFDDVIVKNYGEDISRFISDVTLNKFATTD
ncbi:MAG: restriction endonuclease [Chitinivibrionia bacterium]|nr:restriction endonuclease [Chitinivibrionia bacterium]